MTLIWLGKIILKTIKNAIDMTGMQNHFIKWNQNNIALALGIELNNKFEFTKTSIDTRTIEPNELFIALVGTNFDGNNFAHLALEKGAAAVLVSKITDELKGYEDKIVLVKDTSIALKNMAIYRRSVFKGKVIGITGSVGKTSTKEMAKIALGSQLKVFASHGNFNNHIGLPLNLINMPNDTEVAILEMGMSAKGELAALSLLARPDISIITLISPAHLESFNSLDEIAVAKSEIFSGMTLDDGFAILNKDDKYYQFFANLANVRKLQVVSFGEYANANFQLLKYEVIEEMSHIEANCLGQKVNYTIDAVGLHLAKNSLSVLAAIHIIGANVQMAAKSLEMFQSLIGRGKKYTIDNLGIEVIDDCYNASPAAVKVALHNLRYHVKAGSRLIAVLGDMRPLGSSAPSLHEDLLDDVLSSGVEKVYTVGPLMEYLFNILPNELKGIAVESSEEMSLQLPNYIKPNDIVLFKGSKVMQIYKIIDKLKEFKQ